MDLPFVKLSDGWRMPERWQRMKDRGKSSNYCKGYGKRIMLYAIEAAKEHFDAKQIDIEAQEYAKGFYESVGFKQSSETFMLDGIPHIRMTLRL